MEGDSDSALEGLWLYPGAAVCFGFVALIFLHRLLRSVCHGAARSDQVGREDYGNVGGQLSLGVRARKTFFAIVILACTLRMVALILDYSIQTEALWWYVTAAQLIPDFTFLSLYSIVIVFVMRASKELSNVCSFSLDGVAWCLNCIWVLAFATLCLLFRDDWVRLRLVASYILGSQFLLAFAVLGFYSRRMIVLLRGIRLENEDMSPVMRRGVEELRRRFLVLTWTLMAVLFVRSAREFCIAAGVIDVNERSQNRALVDVVSYSVTELLPVITMLCYTKATVVGEGSGDDIEEAGVVGDSYRTFE